MTLLPFPTTSLTQKSRADSELLLRLLQERTRRSCRTSLAAWSVEALAPIELRPAPHHLWLIQHLQDVAEGRCSRLMVFMPPGSAKSTYATVLFPAWFLARKPRLSVIGASHTADLAEGFSRRVMSLVRDHGDILGYGLENEAVSGWSATNGGHYKAAGVGGPITGRRADLAIIDDPVKSRAVAESPVERDKVWSWFTADLRTRMRPGGAIVLIMTRWHEDDLGGRLLETQRDLWRVLKLPAIASDDDPLGRAPGEWLWDGDAAYGYGAELRRVHQEAQASGAMRDWGALYQQDPKPAEGGLFQVSRVSCLPAMPAGGLTVRAWDLAATENLGTRDPDWTVGLRMTKHPDNSFVVDDVVRLRGRPEEVEKVILATASRDGRSVRIGIPQDPGQAGKSQVLYFTRKLAGYRVESSPVTGSKETRAAPFASQVNVGNVKIVEGGWNKPFLEELGGFPAMTHDDQVDAASWGFGMLIAPPEPARMVPFNFMGR